MKKIREAYELRDGKILLVFTDGTTMWNASPRLLFAGFEQSRSADERWTENGYYYLRQIWKDTQHA